MPFEQPKVHAGPDGIKKTQAEVEGRTLTFETGRLAVQAAGACAASDGDTQVLGTVSFEQDDGLRFRDHLQHVEVSPVTYRKIYGLV